jgi:hypothetical protein
MPSPTNSILCLAPDVEASVFMIAPERLQLLQLAFKDHTPSFKWPNTISALPSVAISTGVISIPVSGAELLWAASLHYWILYDEYTKDQSNGKCVFDLTGNSRRVNALRAFQWAVDSFKGTTVSRPPDIPAPAKNPSPFSDIHVANELFLTATAWILHHELAHLRCLHPSITTISREEEKEADLSATEWILELEKNPQRRQKRVLGMCVAILVITALDLDTGLFDDQTHPKVFERFSYCLDAAKLDDDHVAYAFSVLMMQIHLTTCKHSLPTPREATFKDLFYDHLFAIRSTQQIE